MPRDTLLTGKKGVLKTGTPGGAYNTLISYPIRNWKVEISGGTIDITDSSNASLKGRSKVAKKFYEWSGEAEAICRGGDAELGVNDSVEVAFVAHDVNTDEVYWKGTAIVTSLGVSLPVEGEDVVIRTIKFEGTGELNKTDNYGREE